MSILMGVLTSLSMPFVLLLSLTVLEGLRLRRRERRRSAFIPVVVR